MRSDSSTSASNEHWPSPPRDSPGGLPERNEAAGGEGRRTLPLFSGPPLRGSNQLTVNGRTP